MQPVHRQLRAGEAGQQAADQQPPAPSCASTRMPAERAACSSSPPARSEDPTGVRYRNTKQAGTASAARSTITLWPSIAGPSDRQERQRPLGHMPQVGEGDRAQPAGTLVDAFEQEQRAAGGEKVEAEACDDEVGRQHQRHESEQQGGRHGRRDRAGRSASAPLPVTLPTAMAVNAATSIMPSTATLRMLARSVIMRGERGEQDRVVCSSTEARKAAYIALSAASRGGAEPRRHEQHEKPGEQLTSDRGTSVAICM